MIELIKTQLHSLNLKQPKALTVLFITEMCEEYGFFTLQPLLIFYLIKKLTMTDTEAYVLCGQFTALVFLTPVIGGWIADRFFGTRIAIQLGGLLMSCGYALVALGTHVFIAGLSCIIIGNGLFKPNVSSFLGEFYTADDPRREAGFTLFYVSANLGALLAMIFSGYIQQWWGWGACFGIPAFILLLGIVHFRLRFDCFDIKGLSPVYPAETVISLIRKKPNLIFWFFASLSCVYFMLITLQFGNLSLYLTSLFFWFYLIKMSFQCSPIEQRRILALIILFVIATFYKAMFFETYFSVNVYTERIVDRTFLQHTIPAVMFVGLGGLFSIPLGYLFAKIFHSNKLPLSCPLKFSFSILLIGLAFQILAWCSSQSTTLLSMRWILLFRFIFAISELLILPIGFALVTKYAPRNCVSLMMGAWFMSAAFGGKLAGFLAKSTAIPQGVTELAQIQIVYSHAFQHYAYFNYIVFILCLMIVPLINRLLDN